MIGIPEELRPASLLWIDGLCQTAKDLRKNCRRFAPPTDLRVLDAWRGEAEDLLSTGHTNGCAVVMICLADLYREYGKLGSALECSEEAERHFCCWDEIQHRHNHAVALYSMGLAHQLIGSRKDALDRYNEALEVFETARTQWILDRKEKWRRRCEMAMRWIETLRRGLSDARSRGEPPPKTQVAVPVLSRIAAGEPMLADEDFDEWVHVGLQLADHISFALRAEGDSMVGARISPGDLALIEQNQADPPNGQIVAIFIDRTGGEATLKKFYREKDHVRLEPANTSYPLIILKPYSVPDEQIDKRYAKSHPKRVLDIHSGVDPLIVGWVRSVLPETTPVKQTP